MVTAPIAILVDKRHFVRRITLDSEQATKVERGARVSWKLMGARRQIADLTEEEKTLTIFREWRRFRVKNEFAQDAMHRTMRTPEWVPPAEYCDTKEGHTSCPDSCWLVVLLEVGAATPDLADQFEGEERDRIREALKTLSSAVSQTTLSMSQVTMAMHALAGQMGRSYDSAATEIAWAVKHVAAGGYTQRSALTETQYLSCKALQDAAQTLAIDSVSGVDPLSTP